MSRDQHPGRGAFGKRTLDLVSSALGVVATAPVMAAVAVAIKATSPGPVFFRQERIGRNGVPFQITKFRSMTDRPDRDGPLVTGTNDPRITPVGAVLRKTKLDELPQLFDVLRGDMSLVGPRPEVSRYVDMWEPDARDEILSVRPGITDPAAIVYRNEQDELAQAEDPEAHYVDVILPRKVAMYREYVRTRTLRGDLKVLSDTARAVLRD